MRRDILRLGLGLLLCAVASANAQPRYTRQQNVQIAVQLSDRVKPLTAAPTPAPAKPSLDETAVRAMLGVVAGPTTAAAALEQLQHATQTDPTDSASLFELGMATARNAMALRKASEPTSANGAKQSPADAKRLNEAKAMFLRSVKAFKQLSDDDRHRAFSRMDVALFHYGLALQDFRYMKEARMVYDKLLKNYPSSIYVPAAHLAFADYYFDAGQLADAEARYKMVLKFPKASGYWYAMYKLGWVHMHVQRFQEALETMFQVAQATKTEPALASLATAARTDFVVAYAEIGKPEKAVAAFSRVHQPSAIEMTTILAGRYLAIGRPEKAAVTYRELVASARTHANACTWQYTAARAMLAATGVPPEAKVTEIEALAKLSKTSADPECRTNALAMTSELARAWHEEATKTKNAESFAAAARLHRAANELAPSIETRVLLAEAAWSHAEQQPARWAAAGDAFLDVSRDTTTPPERARDAALAATLAYKNALAIDPDFAVQAGPLDMKRKKLPITKLTAVEESLLDAFGVYATLTKNSYDGELGTMRFVEAALYRRHGDHESAVPVLQDYVRWNHDDAGVELAARMLLDSLMALGKTREAIETAGELATDAKLVEKPELKRAIDFVRSRSRRR